MFITFEGIDGCGKTTQAKMLADFLGNQLGFEVLYTSEPTENPPEGVDEIEFFDKDRRDHVKNVIEPALNDGRIVICDRYIDSFEAYQGEANNRGLRAPDMTFFIALLPEVAMERMKSRGRKSGYDMAGIKFFEDVSERYELIAEREGRVMRVNGILSHESLHRLIRRSALNLILSDYKRLKKREIKENE